MAGDGVAQEPGAGRDALPEKWQRAFRWIEQTLGGELRSWKSQARWRPAWFLELERDGERLPLYFRGDRGETDHGVYTLEREMRVLQVLEREGIPVPHVYGFCEDPRGIVMARAPGRVNLATAESAEERESVLENYVELLARMHAIDVRAFEAIGLERPASPEQVALGDFDVWERGYRARKRRPEPLIEFLIRWVRRNQPAGRDEVTFLAGDSGQFLFEHGRVTAVIDLELAYLGDPAADLAGLRTRDLSEPLGDLVPALARYAELSGRDLDPQVVDFHTVRFAACTPMAVAPLVAQPLAGVDSVQYLAWYLVYSRAPLDVIARRLGLPLDPIEPLSREATRHGGGHDALVEQLRATAANSSDPYPIEIALRAAEYLRRAEQLGPAAEARDLDEVAALLGRRPASWREADAELEALVLEADGEREPELVSFFRRRVLRQEAILRPVLRELTDVEIQAIA